MVCYGIINKLKVITQFWNSEYDWSSHIELKLSLLILLVVLEYNEYHFFKFGEYRLKGPLFPKYATKDINITT